VFSAAEMALLRIFDTVVFHDIEKVEEAKVLYRQDID
jgi:hypothetical protein